MHQHFVQFDPQASDGVLTGLFFEKSTFSGLSTIHSSSTDAYPNTPTFTFYGSRYTSTYLTFTPVEETRNYRVGNSTSQNAPYGARSAPH